MQISDFQTISQLFSEQNVYTIPRYQRRYVWNKTNWEVLWRDIIQLSDSNDDKHFAGTIITYEETNKLPEIIDGQQRLTTFQIILCVIRDLWISDEYQISGAGYDHYDNIKNKLDGLISSPLLARRPDELPKYRLVPTSLDSSAFESVTSQTLWKRKISNNRNTSEAFNDLFEKGFNNKGEQSEQDLITTAYGYFGKELTTYLKGRPNKLVDLANLFELLTIRFRVIKVTIESNDEDDPERIFQTINDTGRMLTDFDYLRNYLFLRTRKWGEAVPIDKLYDSYWARFEEWNDKELKLFFQTFLKAKLGPEYFESDNEDIKPFDCYRKYIDAPQGSAESDFIPLLQLSRYADSYKELNSSAAVAMNNSEVRKLGNRMRFCDYLGLPRLDWFLLFMKHAPELSDLELLKKSNKHDVKGMLESYPKLRETSAGVLSDADLNDLCDILESYVVRNGFLYRHYETSYEVINNFHSRINSGLGKSEFVKYLSESWPNSEDVEKVLKEGTNSVVRDLPDLVGYVLWRIELFSHPSKKLNFDRTLNIKGVVSQDDSNRIARNRKLRLSESVKLLNKINKASKGIGNYIASSPPASLEANWNADDILNRTEELLKLFNEIWNPKI